MINTFIQWIIGIIGVLVCLKCVWIFFSFDSLVELANNLWEKKFTIYIDIFLRAVFGAMFFYLAPKTQQPLIFQSLSYFIIFTAVLMVFIGRKGIKHYFAWLINLRPLLVRLLASAGFVLGVFIIYWSFMISV